MKLYELAKLIRAKNAGPFMLTIDILFEDEASYEKVIASKKLTQELIAELYKMPLEQIEYYELPLARAIKFSFPRKHIVGSFGDSDIFGGQEHWPLVDIEI